jgi:hypothetical protein
MPATCPAHLIVHDFIILMTFGGKVHIIKVLTAHFLQKPDTSSPLGPNILLSTLVFYSLVPVRWGEALVRNQGPGTRRLQSTASQSRKDTSKLPVVVFTDPSLNVFSTAGPEWGERGSPCTAARKWSTQTDASVRLRRAHLAFCETYSSFYSPALLRHFMTRIYSSWCYRFQWRRILGVGTWQAVTPQLKWIVRYTE